MSQCARCGSEWAEIGPEGRRCIKGHTDGWAPVGPGAAASTASAAPERRVTPTPYVSRRLFDVEEEQLEIVMPGLLVLGKLTELIGDADTGKTVVAIDLLARLTRGHPMPDGSPGLGQPADVVFATAEDGLGDTIKPRANVAGADTRRIHTFEFVRHGDEQWFPSFPDDVGALEHLVRSVGARAVVLDPLTAYLGSEIDAHRDHDVRRVLTPLARMATETGAAVLAVRHLNKSQTAQVLYRGSGSIGFTAAARGSMALVRPNPDRESGDRVLAKVKYNLGPAPAPLRLTITSFDGQPVAKWLGAAEGFDLGAALGPRTPEESGMRTQVDEARAFLRELLGDGPVEGRDVQRQAHDAGITAATLRRAFDAENVRSWRPKGQKNPPWYWDLAGPGPGDGGQGRLDHLRRVAPIPGDDQHDQHVDFESENGL